MYNRGKKILWFGQIKTLQFLIPELLLDAKKI